MAIAFSSGSFSSGKQIELLFDDSLDQIDVESKRIKIKEGKKKIGIESISISGDKVNIALEDFANEGVVYKVKYKDKRKDERENVFQSLDGKDAGSFKAKVSFDQKSGDGDDSDVTSDDSDSPDNRKEIVSNDKKDYTLSKDDLFHPSFAKTNFMLRHNCFDGNGIKPLKTFEK